MCRQSPIIRVKKIAEQTIPALRIPEEVKQLRAFYEGVIACSHTKNCERLTKNPYTEGSDHFHSWNIGWLHAEPAVVDLMNRRLEHFKFLKRVV